jgi:hypothetical protein
MKRVVEKSLYRDYRTSSRKYAASAEIVEGILSTPLVHVCDSDHLGRSY